MTFVTRLGAVFALTLVAAFAIGCSETVIDSAKTEDALKQNLEQARKEKISSVDCPSDQKVEADTTFTCNVKLSKGEEETATLEILNDDADVSVIKLSGGNE